MTVLATVYLQDNFVHGIILIICLGIVYEYIKKLEKKSDVDIKKKRIGIACYFVTGIIGLLIFFQ